jgi:thioredoxin reductase (NADPH)
MHDRRGERAPAATSRSDGLREVDGSSAAPPAPSTIWPLHRAPYHLETSLPGVFVAGDARAKSGKRVASAVGEGAMAVMLVHRYLAQQ